MWLMVIRLHLGNTQKSLQFPKSIHHSDYPISVQYLLPQFYLVVLRDYSVNITFFLLCHFDLKDQFAFRPTGNTTNALVHFSATLLGAWSLTLLSGASLMTSVKPLTQFVMKFYCKNWSISIVHNISIVYYARRQQNKNTII